MFIFRFPVLPCKRANDIQPTWYITVFFVYPFGIFQWILFYLREYQHSYTPCISLCLWKLHKFCSSINDSNKPMHIRKIYMHTIVCTVLLQFTFVTINSFIARSTARGTFPCFLVTRIFILTVTARIAAVTSISWVIAF